MTITHHLDDATILAFAAGTAGEAHGIVVAAHLAQCASCRKALHEAESLGGEILRSQIEEPISDLCRAATLASLDAVLPAVPNPVPQTKGDLPPALARAMGGIALDNIRWKKKAPGVAVFDVPLSADTKTKLKLLRVSQGKSLPEHGHGGEELTLVLKGSYRDHLGRFAVGDVADLDPETDHQPIADSAEDCICVVAFESSAKFKSLLARLVQPFVGF